LKKQIILVAALVAGAVALLAPTASAATLTVAPVSDDPAWDGFYAYAPTGWKVGNCWGNATYPTEGTLKLYMADGWDTGRATLEPDYWFSEQPTSANVSCNLYKRTVRYERRWRTFTKSRYGIDTSSRSKSGNCFFRGDSWTGWLTLDCWGGSYARARYRFNLPEDARNITRTIRGSTGCCSYNNSTVSRSWARNTATVIVTNWRAYTIKRVKIEYEHRVRVRIVKTQRDSGTGTWTG
jgi:hypothetical protein